MSKELILKLRYIALCADRADVRETVGQAADALEAKAAPVAYITGQFAGRCIIEAINRAAVLPTGMALYATPQPSAAPHGWKLVPVEPTPEMVSAAEEAYMPFGDMDIALRMAILAAPSAPKADSVNQQLLEALEGMVEYFPEGSSDGECFSVDAARAAIAAARKGESK